MEKQPMITTKVVGLSDIKATDENINGKNTIEIDGEVMKQSSRFLNSFVSRFGFGKQTLSLFSMDEVIERLIQTRYDREIQVALEHTDDGIKCLSVSSPTTKLPRVGTLIDILNNRGIDGLSYDNGILTGSFDFTRISGLKIGDDNHKSGYHIQIPLDGYGKPCTYLQLLREVCTNKMVGLGPAWKQVINIGDNNDSEVIIRRFIDSYSNEEGIAAIQDRMEKSMITPASLSEVFKAQRLLRNIETPVSGDRHNTPVDKWLYKFLKDSDKYGIISESDISEKVLKMIPSKVSVYGLINLVTEISSHFGRDLPLIEQMKLDGFTGTLISDNYDMEGFGKGSGFDDELVRDTYFQACDSKN